MHRIYPYILGFLPSPEAVRTSLLARRWRHLWKSATGLRVGCRNGKELMSVEEAWSLLNHLMILCGGAPLDTCELTFDDFGEQDDVAHVNLWFRQAVMCKARVLRLHILSGHWLELDNLPLVSKHLKTLHLYGVRLHSKLLNFSRRLALEYLDIECCNLSTVTKILSDSLKHLCIDDSVLPHDSRMRIQAPNLISLCLDVLRYRIPMLCSMPSLVEAFIKIDMGCSDCCNAENDETCDCESCDMADGSSNCVLLKGVSHAKNLALISTPEMFVFKKDLRWGPMFRMLKTLLLNEYWCVPNDFVALAYILEHSPVLEKLTLQLFSERLEHKVKMKLCVSSTKRSPAISEHLKKVELKCEVIDDKVLKVLKFLCTYNICFSFE
ncbi:hypothetical protein U9M48_004498 [Paspalum notatum var. saurae]|uniref:Uncharacterized protein n=1 Tax=Paspalum notatum var. saurae TaxID=547442 RepID=A0AAQ3SKT1_PASNO